MKTAPLHSNEQQRLEALIKLQVLDTLPEKEFDEITLIASQICQTPIALISLVDNSRQWFKSKIGITASETPRDWAFCAHAILQNEAFVVSDASRDDRFHDNPLVKGDPHVQFYAGIPILSPDQLPIGTLCVIDQKPRQLNQDQINSLKALANQVHNLMQLRTQNSALQAANKKMVFHKAILDSMQEGVVLHDATGAIVDFNPAALRILGLTAEQITGRTSLDPNWRTVKEDGTTFDGPDHPAMISLKTGKTLKDILMGVKTPNNQIKWISIKSVPLFFNETKSPSHAAITFSDITEKRLLDQAIMHSAKMVSLGEMAGGIAHEINNPLTIISANADQIKKSLIENRFDQEYVLKKLEKIQFTTTRIEKIVKGLRAFARDSKNDPLQTVKISQVIDDAFALCYEKFRSHSVTINSEIESDSLINCVPTQMTQVILNLLNNSFDAISELPEKWIKISIKNDASNKLTKVFVTDSGKGIPNKVLEKLMQPFFTTKDVGKGTGLGLSIAKGFVELFKGKLYYALDNGNTCFVIEIPNAVIENKKTAA